MRCVFLIIIKLCVYYITKYDILTTSKSFFFKIKLRFVRNTHTHPHNLQTSYELVQFFIFYSLSLSSFLIWSIDTRCFIICFVNIIVIVITHSIIIIIIIALRYIIFRNLIIIIIIIIITIMFKHVM